MARSKQSLGRSFACAVKGVGCALKSERNLRIHFTVGAYLFWFARYYDFSRLEWAILVLIIGLVIAIEMINTAIEKTVDLESPGFHPMARLAKDVAAGAVLMSSTFSVVVGLLLFWDVDMISYIWQDVILFYWPFWFLLAVITVWWVFFFPPGKEPAFENEDDGQKNTP